MCACVCGFVCVCERERERKSVYECCGSILHHVIHVCVHVCVDLCVCVYGYIRPSICGEYITDSIAIPLISTKFKNSNSSVQIKIKSKSQFVVVLRDTEKSEFLDLVDLGNVACTLETVIGSNQLGNTH